jgi:oligopeptide/dipeptide ABC transporter ATP-binding protein
MTALSTLGLLPLGGETVWGSVRLDGTDLLTLSESQMRDIRGRDVGVVFQDHLTAFNPTMTIGGQIAEVLRIHRGWNRTRALGRAEEVLELVEMPHPRERLKQYPHQLSGGLRQRSMIAMALACEPKLLIADEPTTALDVTVQAQIFALLDELKRELNMAILLITHDLGVVAGHADNVCVMYAGKIVEEASVDDLFENPRHRYTEALLGSIPRLDQSERAPVTGIAGSPPDLLAPIGGCRFHPRCGHATEECVSTEPVLTDVGRSRYACYHPASRPRSEGT